ncbi:sterol carrier protein 2 [Aspergillus nanangensis]|uniref:propanoyl-CoA C-acyltransferase n=1 Tax=Aspergillus nanangensis TaxID=2582783 RepID=A0AAD4GTT0_ASPNN|nr:sterol carrier protein 2 [Aspergillus nanangensis]
MTPSPVYIAGVGMTPFQSPKKSAASSSNPEGDYFNLAVSACVKALLDAGITYDEVDQGVGSYVFGDSAGAQRVFYTLGMTGIPIYNVHNYCSAGSTGLYMANQFIQAGCADCVLVVGFDKMYPGALPQIYKDRENPLGRILELSKKFIPEGQGESAGWTPQLYANAQAEYLEKYGPAGAKPEHFAAIAATNRTHGMSNPYSQLRQAVTTGDVSSSPQVSGSITRLQCCPSSTGAAAAILVSERFLQSHPYLKQSAVSIKGQALATDSRELYEPASAIELIGSNMTRRAACTAFRQASLLAKDIQVIELHDCFTTNEMCAIEDLGLAAHGEGWKLIENGGITYNSKSATKRTSPGWIVNPSGGLISKGHPLGATGLAQITELVWHLRGWAANRCVPQTKHCLQHNMGLGGATVVTILGRADGQVAPSLSEMQDQVDGRQRLGYNPALEARGVRRQDFDAVRSQKASSEWAAATFETEGNPREPRL